MIFSMKELIRWFGVTTFEIYMQLIAFFIFSILLTLKIDHFIESFSWWTIFSPLFITDSLAAYFCTIVFIRQYQEGKYKLAFFRAIWSFNQILLLCLAKLLVCLKLEEPPKSDQQKFEVTSLTSIYVLLILLLIRACQLH